MLVQFETKEPGYLINALCNRIEKVVYRMNFNGWVELILQLDPETPLDEINLFAEEMQIGTGDRRTHWPKIVSGEEQIRLIARMERIEKENEIKADLEEEEMERKAQLLVERNCFLSEKYSYRNLVRESAQAGIFGKFYEAKYGNLSNKIRKEICKEVWKDFQT